MAKKQTRTHKKPKVLRMSANQATIAEGRDYVTRYNAFAILRARRVVPSRAPKTTPIQKKPKKAARRSRPARPAVPSAPLVVPAVMAPVPVVTISPTVVRSGSRSLSRTGSKNQIIIEQELQDRLGRHNANIGKLNFSLRWWDPNDLDLHVTCPCNTEISFMNKRCGKCGGELDIDMNVGINMSLEPVEHVYFNNPKPGLYKFFVRYYNGPKQYAGVKGADKSKYALSLHEDMNQIFRYEDTVSNTQRDMHYDFNR